MDKTARDAQLRRLARAARVGGRASQQDPRTHYLTPTELRGVPASRLVRETARAERRDASETWRDGRRDDVAREFARRGYPETASTVRASWDAAEYNRVRAEEAEQRTRRVEDDPDYQRAQARDYAAGAGPDLAEAAVVGAAAFAMTDLAADGLDNPAGEGVLSEQQNQLEHTWEHAEGEPELGGEIDASPGSIGADFTDSLAAEPATTTPTVETGQATTQPDVTPQIE